MLLHRKKTHLKKVDLQSFLSAWALVKILIQLLRLQINALQELKTYRNRNVVKTKFKDMPLEEQLKLREKRLKVTKSLSV